MKKLGNTEAELKKKALPIKKACNGTTISKIIGLVVGIIETSKFVQQLKK